MKKQKKAAETWVALIAILIMILDSKSALDGAKEGLNLCFHTVIPSLFPFFLFATVINSNLLGQNLPFMIPIRRLCNIPKGTESIALLGCIAGYPVGAQLVTQAYNEKKISSETAKRMLGFCSNAGLSFIFGMLTPLFQSKIVPLYLWMIHIGSAFIVGCLLPKTKPESCKIDHSQPISFANAMSKSVKNISIICGWIVIFRIIITFAQKWFMWLFPSEIQIALSGLIELSNGCIMLTSIPSQGLRFVLSSSMLAAGGICIAMQTLSVTESLGTGYYFPGKLLQAAISVLLSVVVQPLIFPTEDRVIFSNSHIICLFIFILFLICLINRKILVAFTINLLYNNPKPRRKGATKCCFAKK